LGRTAVEFICFILILRIYYRQREGKSGAAFIQFSEIMARRYPLLWGITLPFCPSGELDTVSISNEIRIPYANSRKSIFAWSAEFVGKFL
jgi:hypothetical protein